MRWWPAAADPVLAPWREAADLGVVLTGAWILPDERPLPAELEAFLDAVAPPVYAGFGSMRAPENLARMAIEAIRAQGRRVLLGRGWAALTPAVRARAKAVAGTIRTDGATVAAELLLDAVSRDKAPVSA